MDTWVVSTVWLLCIILQQSVACGAVFESLLAVLCGPCLGGKMLGRLLIVWLVFRGLLSPWLLQPGAYRREASGAGGPSRAGQGRAWLMTQSPAFLIQLSPGSSWSGLVGGARPDKPTRLTPLDFRPEMTETFNQETTEVPLQLQERGLP